MLFIFNKGLSNRKNSTSIYCTLKKRLVLINEGVGVVGALMTWSKSKTGVVSGLISSTDLESEESETFRFRSTDSETEAKEPTNHNACSLTL